ncbi:Uncharacterised protein [Vibrio cholerae]|uniref:Uncharacterized protein n=1 Tax=Vibrio cholerae TaxID=666 RepID=A0A655YI90_VIBCL|nr:Uncharacterised protein [Vibrio cholerae]
MHGVRYFFPTGNLRLRKQPRSVRVALSIGANNGGFGNDQSGIGTACVIRHHGIGRHQIIISHAARQWRHRNSVV